MGRVRALRGGVVLTAVAFLSVASTAQGQALDTAHAHPALKPTTTMGKWLLEASQAQPTPSPDEPAGDRAAPKNLPPGTIKKYHFWYGPYAIPPGEDSQRVDIGLPLDNGFMLSVEPRLRNMDMSTPSMLEGHIHHAHWFVFNGSGLEWIFGNGDEGTRASFEVMNKVDPVADYGQFIDKNAKQIMVFMLHNRTSKGQTWWVDLEVTFLFGTEAQLNAPDLKAKRGDGKDVRDIASIMSGSTFDVPRQPNGDGEWNTTEQSSLKGGGLTVDQKDGQGLDLLLSTLLGRPVDTTGPYEWIAPKDGTLVELGTHMHPGSTHAIIENMGSPTNPCPNDHHGTGGTLLLRADTINMHVPFSDDYQIEITQPGWRVPIHKGDHIRLTGYYENKFNAWPASMTISGMGIDYRRVPPKDLRCTVYRVGPPVRVRDIRPLDQGVVAADDSGKPISSIRSFWGGWPRSTPEGRAYVAAQRAAAKKRAKARKGSSRRTHARKATFGDPLGDKIIPITDGIPNRQWHHSSSPWCGEQYAARACERSVQARPAGRETTLVLIQNFLYEPGDMSLSGMDGAPPRIHQGQQLEFVNGDAAVGVRHSVTTCKWPCNGPYTSNYPHPDGVWESGTFGPDLLGDGMVIGQAATPKDLPVGQYAYFCRIHPWMRGAFEVVK